VKTIDERIEWETIRAQFALSPDWIHLCPFLLASHPDSVSEAIEAHRRGLDENPVEYLQDHDDWPTCRAAAKYLDVRPDDVALVGSTTMGLSVLYGGIELGADAEVLTTLHDHYSMHESLRLAALRSGASVRRIPLYERLEAVSEEEIVESLVREISSKTRVVAVTWVHSSTGLKIPVGAIGAAIAEINEGRSERDRMLFCVDGVHGFGIEDRTMADLQCDFFVAGCHKWIFGPRGTGLVWGRPEAWAALRPTIPTFSDFGAWVAWQKGSPPPASSGQMLTPGGFHAFEHRWALAEAFEFHLAIGKQNIEARTHELNRHCKEGLANMAHVTLHTPRASALSSGIVCFEVSGLPPERVVAKLRAERVIAATTPYLPVLVRIAPSILNSHEEIDRTLRAISGLA
jgi:isopenicillin-N epimerase